MFSDSVLLSQSNLRDVISMRDAVDTVRAVYRAHGEGQVVMPPKLTLDLGESNGWPHLRGASNSMPAYVDCYDAAGIKWASGYRDNPTRGLPLVIAVIVLNDPRTGWPVCVMDGTLITELRTGASAAVFADAMANPGALKVGLLGAGAQGRATTQAFACMCNSDRTVKISCYDRIPAASTALAHATNAEGLTVEPAGSIDEALEGADVIITATSANRPLVQPRHVKRGATVVTLGSFTELAPEIVVNADKIVVDNWEQNTHRGELASLIEQGIISRENLYAEIGEILAHRKPGRQSLDDVIVCSPIGIATLDVALAKLAFDRARDLGLGSRFRFID